MFVTESIREAPTDRAEVYAFHIVSEVTSEDMRDMAAYMNDRFDHHDSVSMLLIFDTSHGSETGAGWDWDTIKSQFRSVSKVDKYAVLNAPEGASRMIEGFGKILPLEARAFDDADAAWAFVGATPRSAGMGEDH